MEFRFDPRTRERLTVRRQRLVEAVAAPGAPPDLGQLLDQVDAALGRVDAGTYGLCETCHEPIEEGRLHADPLVRFCLDHLDTAERQALERDLAMAAQVQRALLPRQDVSVAGWEVRHHFAPLGPVSGDYCDLLVPRGASGGLLFAVGDVSGKGVAASLLSAHLSALFRTLDDLDLSVADMLPRANRLFCESTTDAHYATLVAGRAFADGTVEIANAAQAPPLVARGGRVVEVGKRGLPLGMFCDSPYPAQTIRLEPGDALALYTDGVTETRDPRGEEFGPAKLREALAHAPPDSARAVAHAILAALDTFRAGAPRHDDLTLLILRRSG